MKLHLSLIALLVLFFSFYLHAQERQSIPTTLDSGHASEDQRLAIEVLVRDYQRAWQTLNAEVLANLHSEDVEWINAYARLFRGRAVLHKFLSERLFPLFERALAGHEPITLKVISTRHLNSSAAVVHLYTDFKLGAAPSRRTHFHLVLNQHEGTWQIVHSAIMDALD